MILLGITMGTYELSFALSLPKLRPKIIIQTLMFVYFYTKILFDQVSNIHNPKLIHIKKILKVFLQLKQQKLMDLLLNLLLLELDLLLLLELLVPSRCGNTLRMLMASKTR